MHLHSKIYIKLLKITIPYNKLQYIALQSCHKTTKYNKMYVQFWVNCSSK